MALQGDLKNMPLADVLQTLKANRQSGTLMVHDGRKELHLYFDGDKIMHVSPGHETERYLLPALLLRFDITDEKLQREVQRRAKRTIAAQLQRSKVTNAKTVHHLHAVYLTEYLYQAFTWNKGTFEFEDSDSPGGRFDRDQCAVRLNLPVEQIVLESMRRLDEWKQIRRVIPTMDDVLIISDLFKSQQVQVTEPAMSILGLCDGEHSVTQIAYSLGLETFTVAQVVAEHLRTNYLRRVRAEDLTALAERHFDKGDISGALKFFKRSVELDGTNMDVRGQFAELCRREGDLSEATTQYKTLAQQAREREEIDRAKGYYETLVDINPSDHQVQQRLYEMLEQHDDPDAVDAGLALAATYRRLDLRSDEAAHLRRMSAKDPTNCTVLEQLADADMALGDREAAADNFSRAAQYCIERNETERACSLLEKTLLADPEDTRSERMLADLRSGIFHEKQRKRRRTVALAVLGAVLLGFVAYAIYNGVAARHYLELRNSNLELVRQRRFDAIPARLTEFSRRFPLTLLLLDVEHYRRTLDDVAQAHDAALDSVAQSLTAPSEDNFVEATTAVEQPVESDEPRLEDELSVER
ncbi:MAG: DUF4388 domain-containing protein [Chitinivibrionales bacterium]|nr:DUF4388 domain-containing protein [Chitinivibrionales bacterium]